MTDIRERLLAAFELEYQDHLATIREALRLAGGGTMPDLIDVHRRAHSLKGAARAVDLPDVEAISHRLEAVFLAVQAGTLPLDIATTGAIRRSLDAIEDVVAWSMRGGEEVALAGVLADLDRLVGQTAGPAPVERRQALAGGAAERPDGDRQGGDRQGGDRPGSEGDGPALVRIGSEGLERLFTATAALLPEVEAQAMLAAQLRQMRGEWRALERSWRDVRGRVALTAPEDGNGIEALLAGFERRMRGLGGALDGAYRSHDRLLWSLRRWGGGLQEDVRRLRMVPVESTFRGLGRMIRELSRSQGKEVEVDVRGMEVQADRSVLQRLKDPILHIARNAVSHGVETPRERDVIGKRPAASVLVEAVTVGSRLRIRVEDDGRGLNLPAVADRAVALGLLSEEEALQASSERLIELLYEPGLSTAETATEISGRGMGMAIARREVQSLQGTLLVAERPGGGTTVIIEVPLSLLSQRLVFLRVQDSVLALPTADIVRLVQITPDALLTGTATPMVRIGEDDIPLASLAALLGLETPPPAKAGQRLAVAVVRLAERRMALIIDEFLHAADTIVAAAEESGIDPARFLGTVLLGDGSPALVLNVVGLFTANGGEIPQLARPMEAAPAVRSHILVVDDSITTRTLEKSILEAHGYRVTQCVDGREALERLLEGIDVELVISDVEMPRMDGFALLQAVKSNPNTADLPVILVTSRASDEDRERGLRLGADAYIVKTRFDQNELLAGIRRLL